MVLESMTEYILSKYDNNIDNVSCFDLCQIIAEDIDMFPYLEKFTIEDKVNSKLNDEYSCGISFVLEKHPQLVTKFTKERLYLLSDKEVFRVLNKNVHLCEYFCKYKNTLKYMNKGLIEELYKNKSILEQQFLDIYFRNFDDRKNREFIITFSVYL